MKRFHYLIFPFAILLILVSCDRKSSEAPYLGSNRDRIETPSDAVAYADPNEIFPTVVRDTVMVSSTRSWSATISTMDYGDWVSLENAEHINVSGIMEETPLVLVFDRYRGTEKRTAKLEIFAADLERSLTMDVVQDAYKPFLEVVAPDSHLPSVGAECQVIVRSNTHWTAIVMQDLSSVMPDLSVKEGNNSSVITLTFPNNMDDQAEKKAVVKFMAEGCDARLLEFSQNRSERFFCLDENVPEEVAPYLNRIHIPLKSNGAWTAEISDCTFSNARLEPSYGTNSLSGFDFVADHGSDPQEEMKSATVTIHREDMEDIVVSFCQRGSIHLHTCNINPEYEWLKPDLTPYSPYESAGFPFSSPASLPNSFSARTHAGEAVDCVMKDGGYVFTMFGSDCGVWFSSSNTALCIGKMKDDYVLLPAIEGYRLAAMYYQASCRVAVPYTVRTEDGSQIIKGGEYALTSKVVPVDTEYHDVHTHIFPQTSAGERYRINLEEDYGQISIKDLCLVYEIAF